METILLRYFQCMMGVIGVINLITCLFWLWREFFRIWREKEAKQKEGCQQQEKRIWLPEPPVILTPKEHREYMLTISRTDVFTQFPRPAALTPPLYAQNDTMPKKKCYIVMLTFG